jgi:hypothetical protein
MLGILFIAIGAIALVYGALTVLGIVGTDTHKDSEFDKKLFSDKNRYFIGRYWAGLQGVIAGIGFIALGAALYLMK